MSNPRMGMLCSRICLEERLLLEAAESRGIALAIIDSKQIVFDLASRTDVDVVLQREMLHARALYALSLFESGGVKTINGYRVALTCGDRIATMKALCAAGVPTPEVRIAFTRASAIDAIEEMRYPVVLKPVTGRSDRLIAKVNDRDAALAILEHKEHLGSYYHKIFYVQKHPQGPVRDLRATVIGYEVVHVACRDEAAALRPRTPNPFSESCPITADIRQISLAAAEAVGGGALCVELLETKDGLMADAVSDMIHFQHCGEAVAKTISEKLIDYALEVSCYGLK